MSNPTDRLALWILEKAQSEEPTIRARVLRDAAETLVGAKAAGLMVELASKLETQESLYQQLLLEFRGDNPPMTGPSAKEDVP